MSKSVKQPTRVRNPEHGSTCDMPTHVLATLAKQGWKPEWADAKPGEHPALPKAPPSGTRLRKAQDEVRDEVIWGRMETEE